MDAEDERRLTGGAHRAHRGDHRRGATGPDRAPSYPAGLIVAGPGRGAHGFKRLFGIGEPDEAIEVDTRILGPALPGGELRGEVLLRGGRRETCIDYVDLHVHVRCTDPDGRESAYEVDAHSAEPGQVTLRPGAGAAAHLLAAAAVGGTAERTRRSALGVALSVKSRITRADGDDGIDVDDDLLHVLALPLHEAILDLFAEEGCLCDSADVVEGDAPGTEQRLGIIQTFRLTGHAPGPDRPDALEVTFQTNAVGAMVHVRRAAPDERYWEDKPSARRFPAAHHEAGIVDWLPQVRKVLSELPFPYDR
ncbi:sporulation protein [Streptomyces sp. NPDC019531]|uniref:sporulation protein n=1 Tax=Streptomyces sp. NPDC019531 TaxID=3365062 RepID=UPI00384C59CC